METDANWVEFPATKPGITIPRIPSNKLTQLHPVWTKCVYALVTIGVFLPIFLFVAFRDIWFPDASQQRTVMFWGGLGITIIVITLAVINLHLRRQASVHLLSTLITSVPLMKARYPETEDWTTDLITDLLLGFDFSLPLGKDAGVKNVKVSYDSTQQSSILLFQTSDK